MAQDYGWGERKRGDIDKNYQTYILRDLRTKRINIAYQKKKYNTMNKEERNTFRKEMLGKLEEQWAKSNSPEDDLFYYHPSEDKIVLSHALFWVCLLYTSPSPRD